MDNQQGPTEQHIGSAQCYVAAWMGGKFRGEWIHLYIWLSSFAIHHKLSQQLISYTLIQNKKFKKGKKKNCQSWTLVILLHLITEKPNSSPLANPIIHQNAPNFCLTFWQLKVQKQTRWSRFTTGSWKLVKS